MQDLDHAVISIVVIIVLSVAAVVSEFKPEVVALLSGALGWILGFWFGRARS